MSKIAGKKSAGYSDAPNMHGLAARLCAEGYSRTSGEYKAQPVLIRAGAGTGKTWGTQQVRCVRVCVCVCVYVCVRARACVRVKGGKGDKGDRARQDG